MNEKAKKTKVREILAEVFAEIKDKGIEEWEDVDFFNELFCGIMEIVVRYPVKLVVIGSNRTREEIEMVHFYAGSCCYYVGKTALTGFIGSEEVKEGLEKLLKGEAEIKVFLQP